MSTGSNIRQRREKLGISLEELSLRVPTDIQTLLEWENGHREPNAYQLQRLSDILEVPANSLKDHTPPVETEPLEEYSFVFTREELARRSKEDRRRLLPLLIALGLCLLATGIYPIFTRVLSSGQVLEGLSLSIDPIFAVLATLSLGLGLFVLRLQRSYDYGWGLPPDKLAESVYEYRIYRHRLRTTLICQGLIIRDSTYLISDIRSMNDGEELIRMVIGGESWPVRRTELEEDCFFFGFMAENGRLSAGEERRIAMDVLLVLSVLALAVPCALFLLLWEAYPLQELAKLFYPAAAIPCICALVGLLLLRRGCKCKKHIAAGVVIALLLCLLGLFSPALASYTRPDNGALIRLETITGVDIPPVKSVSTIEQYKAWDEGCISYIHFTGFADFDRETGYYFDSQLSLDGRWLSSLPGELWSYVSAWTQYGLAEHVMLYNTNTGEYNTLPKQPGTYRLVFACYNASECQLRIMEYEVEYLPELSPPQSEGITGVR